MPYYVAGETFGFSHSLHTILILPVNEKITLHMVNSLAEITNLCKWETWHLITDMQQSDAHVSYTESCYLMCFCLKTRQFQETYLWCSGEERLAVYRGGW